MSLCRVWTYDRSEGRMGGGWKSGLLMVLSLGVSACTPKADPPVQPGPAAVAPRPGTYAIAICAACDPRHPDGSAVQGRLVIEVAAFRADDLPRDVQTYFEDSGAFLPLWDLRRPPNSCFVLTRTPGATGYAGLIPVGLTSWVAEPPASFRIPLYQSPDARYVATLAARGDEIQGRGRSSGGRSLREPTDPPPDSIYARRIGPPDRGICIRAAEAEMARRQPAGS
jgi:hypothetical protein